MGHRNWWRRWLNRKTAPLRGGKRAAAQHCRPALEILEERTLPAAPTFTALTHLAPTGIGTVMLLPDGTVMAQGGGANWYRLTPDSAGNYVDGTWSALALMSEQRLYFASNVLNNDKVFVQGGEYSGPLDSETLDPTGEIYDLASNSWSPIAAFPQSSFGDDPSEVLPDGRILTGYLFGPQTYLYDPASDTWSSTTGTKQHNDRSDEEAWVKLPDGSILSYNVFSTDTDGVFEAQRYLPATEQWVDASATDGSIGPGFELSNAAVGYELGPALLLPDGRVFQIGANGDTALYDTTTGVWSAGPQIIGTNGKLYGADDAPGAVLADGQVLFTADEGPTLGTFSAPTAFFDFNPATDTITQVGGLPAPLRTSITGSSAYVERMLTLPNGQTLFVEGDQQLYVATPAGSPQASWAPTITGIASNGAGGYTLTGTQLNGLDEGAAYGDDVEMSSNYPIVRVQDTSGNVSYLTTSNWSNEWVQTGTTPVTTDFAAPANPGTYLLSVSANGISSQNVLFIQTGIGADNLTLRLDPANPADLQILQNGSTVLGEYALTAFTAVDIVGSGAVHIDWTAGFFDVPVTDGSKSILYFPTGPGADNLTVRLDPADPTQLQVLQNGSNVLLTEALASLLAVATIGSGAVDVDYSNGLFGVPVDDNGAAPSNTLTITGALATLTYDATSPGAGTLVFNGTDVFTFQNVTAPLVVPVAGTTTIAVADGQPHAVTLSAGPPPGSDRIAFDGGLTGLTFGNPTALLDLQAGPGSDTFTIASLDAGFNAGLTINGGTGNADALSVNTSLNLSGALTVDSAVETADFGDNVTASSVNVQSVTTADFGGTVTAGPLNVQSATIAFSGAVQAAAVTVQGNLATFGGDVNATSLSVRDTTTTFDGNVVAGPVNVQLGTTTLFAGTVTAGPLIVQSGTTTFSSDILATSVNVTGNAATFDGSVTAGAVSVQANTTVLDGNVTATAGAVIVQSAATTLGTSVTVDSSAGGGAISFSGTVNGAATDAETLTLKAGAGGVVLGGNVGSIAALLGFSASAAAVQLQTVSTGTGGIAVTTTGIIGATLDGDLTSAGAIQLTGNATLGNSITLTHGGAGSLSVSGGTINLTSDTLTDAAPTLASTGAIADVLAGSGGLTKSGAGTLTLTAIDTYQGATTVKAGTLIVDGALAAASAVSVLAGTLAGSGTIAGPITDSAVLVPGDLTAPGVLNTGPATLKPGAALDVAVGGATSGHYDQLAVTGTVNLGNASLNLTAFGGYVPQAGDQYILVSNDGTDTVTGALVAGTGVTAITTGTAIADGALLSGNFLGSGLSAYLDYEGGDGNDVSIVFATPVTFTSPGGDLTLRKRGTNLQLVDAGGTVLEAAPLASVTAVTLNGAANVANSLTVDYASGGVFSVPGGIAYNGGPGTATNALKVHGGAFSTETDTFSGAGGGSVQLPGQTIQFTEIGLLTTDDTTVNRILNLPAGTTNAAVLQDSGVLGMPVQLHGSTPTFPDADFASPTGMLTVNPGSAGDTLAVTASSPANLSAGLTAGSAASPFGSVTIDTPLTLTGGVPALALNGQALQVNASVHTTTTQTYNGALTTGGAVTLTGSTVTLANGGSLGGDLAVTGALKLNGGTLDAAGHAVAVSGLTTLAGGTYLGGAGTQTLTGGLTLSGGNFTGGAGAVSTSNVADFGGTLTAPSAAGAFDVSGNWSVTAGTFLANGGTVTFTGSGTQKLGSGAQAFDNLVQSGTGTLQLTANDLSVAGNFLAGAGTFRENTQNLTVGGNFTLAAGALFAPGAGHTLIFDGTGTITDQNAAAQDLGAVHVTAGAATTLGSAEVMDTLTVDPAGGLDLAGNALQLATLTGAGGVRDSGAAAALTVDNAGTDSFAGTLGGANLALVKTGAGTLLLGGTSSFDGGTTIGAGTVELDAAGALGTDAAAAVTVADGAALLVHTGGGTVVPAITLSGTNLPVGANGGLEVINGGGPVTTTFTGNLSVSAGATLSVDRAIDTVVLDDVVAAPSGMTKAGLGTLQLAGAASNTGGAGTTIVRAGELDLMKTGGAVAVPGALQIADSALGSTASVRLFGADQVQTAADVTLNVTGTLDLNGNAQQVGAVNGPGTVTDSGAAATFTVDNAASDTFTGTLAGANLAFAKTGGGTLIYTGIGSFGGGTDIQAGTLQVDGGIGNVQLDGTGVVLGGIGAVGPITGGSAGTVEPGDGTGTLSSQTVTWNPATTFAVILTNLGGNSQLNVGGDVHLGGAALTAVVGPSITIHHQPFTILQTTGGTIDGSFAGGSTVLLGGQRFLVDYQPTTVNLVPVPTISFTPATLPAATAGAAYSQTLAGQGGTVPYSHFTVTAGALPAGLTLDASTGTLSGTPTAAGPARFTITAQDATVGPASPYTGSQNFTLTVNPPAITFTPTGLPGAQVGAAYSAALTPGGGTPAYGHYTVVSGTLPAGVQLNADGTLSGTPTQDGTFPFKVSVQDATTGPAAPYAGSQSFTLTVAKAVVTLTPQVLPAGELEIGYDQPVSAVGGTEPYIDYRLSAGALPPGLSLNAGTGVISGTPTAIGTFDFTVQVTDSSGGSGPFTGSQAYALVVNPQLAITTTVLATFWTDGTPGYRQTIQTTGGTGAVTFAVTVGSLPTGLTLNPSTGAITGTPSATGSFPFTITATDGVQIAASQAYEIDVIPPGFEYDLPSRTLTVFGTSFKYTQATTADAAGLHTIYTFTMDGNTASFPDTALARVIVHGESAAAGASLITNDAYVGTDGQVHETAETAILGDGAGQLWKYDAQGVGAVFVTLLGFQNIFATMGHADTGFILGTPGGTNTFVSAGSYAYMSSPGAFYDVDGAQYVYGYASTASDAAYQYDGTGASAFVVSGNAYSFMLGTDGGQKFFNEAVGFNFNYGIARHPGQDTAIFYDSPQSDVFVGNTATSYLYSDNAAGSFALFDYAQGFALVEAFSFVGGTDVAYVYDPVVNAVVLGFKRIV